MTNSTKTKTTKTRACAVWAIGLVALLGSVAAMAELAVPNASMTIFDSTPPVLTLVGDAAVSIEVGDAYTDAGATALDNFDGDLTDDVDVDNPVNPDVAGTYTVAYTVSDTAGNAARKTRTVEVAGSDDTLRVTGPMDGAIVYVSATQASVPLTMTAEAESALEFVEYTLDGVPFGMGAQAPFAVTTELDVAGFGWGEHTLEATASVLATHETLTAHSTFTLAPIATEDDTDANGIPDNPFLTLAANGDAWLDAMSFAGTGGTRTRTVALTRFENDATAPVVVVLTDLVRLDTVTVTVPRAVVHAGETGIALVSVSETLDTLFGATEAALFDADPADYALVSGGRYVQVSVIRSADGGATYDDADPALLASHPVHVAMRDLGFVGNGTQTLLAHPTYVDSDPGTGLRVIAADGGWAPETTTVSADAMTAELSAASSVVAPYESLPPQGDPPVITTTALPQGRLFRAYTAQLTAVDGTQPYTWNVVSGSLPWGVSLTANGTLTGKPVWRGTYRFTVSVTDAQGLSDTQELTIIIKGFFG